MGKRGSLLEYMGIDFLTRYGWLILLIIIAMYSLDIYGVFRPSEIFPERCGFNSDIICESYSINKNGFEVTLRNNAGNLEVSGLRVSLDGNNVECVSPDIFISDEIWRKHREINFKVVCDFGDLVEGDDFKKKINMRFSYRSSIDNAFYSKSVNGVIFGVVG
tara:strand:+ start:3548 stop:4033 length:486 start_codon:yes stop_codon:yes gene_type:complete